MRDERKSESERVDSKLRQILCQKLFSAKQDASNESSSSLDGLFETVA